MPLNVPVLLITYKRVETTKEVLESIRKIKPTRLYFASNAPNPGSDEDVGKVHAVRDLVDTIDWECEVKLLFRTKHLSARDSITSSIDWFFDNEPEGIILEDDCVPANSFYRFAAEMLEKYRDNPRVMHISASNFDDVSHWSTDAYSFSKYCFIWGWAGWRSAWRKYHERTVDRDHFESVVEGYFNSVAEKTYWMAHFDYVQSGNIDTWDYNWNFAVWEAGGFTIMPGANQISNVGFGIDATNTQSSGGEHANQQLKELTFPQVHPSNFQPNSASDVRCAESVFSISKSYRTRHLKVRVASLLPKSWKTYLKKYFGT